MTTLRSVASGTFGRSANNYSAEVHVFAAECIRTQHYESGLSEQMMCCRCGGGHIVTHRPQKHDHICII